MNTADVQDFLSEECRRAGGQNVWAAKSGVSPSYVNDVLLGRRGPGASVLAALGLRKLPAEYEPIQSDAPLSDVVAELRAVTARYGGLTREGCGE